MSASHRLIINWPYEVLTEFLLARLDEDHDVAWGGEPSPWSEGKWDGEFDGPREVLGRHGDVTAVCYYGGTFGHVLRFDPTRVLKDVEAKRRIVSFVEELHTHGNDAAAAIGNDTLRELASVYSDHPDYRDEWRP